MSEDNYRRERIERLFQELEHEITRGVLAHEITERGGFEFVIPVSAEGRDWCVVFKADLRPMPRWTAPVLYGDSKFRVIEGGRK